jgi:hypothetical protein
VGIVLENMTLFQRQPAKPKSRVYRFENPVVCVCREPPLLRSKIPGPKLLQFQA